MRQIPDQQKKEAEVALAKKSNSPIPGYSFNRKQLADLDKIRHNIVHGRRLGRKAPSGVKKVLYLMKTYVFLMLLVKDRFSLKVYPQYLQWSHELLRSGIFGDGREK